MFLDTSIPTQSLYNKKHAPLIALNEINGDISAALKIKKYVFRQY
jgi:hypothetical protein